MGANKKAQMLHSEFEAAVDSGDAELVLSLGPQIVNELADLTKALYDRLRLTDAEREAVDTAEASLMRESTDLNTPLPVRQRLGAAAATLRGLLERLG